MEDVVLEKGGTNEIHANLKSVALSTRSFDGKIEHDNEPMCV